MVWSGSCCRDWFARVRKKLHKQASALHFWSRTPETTFVLAHLIEADQKLVTGALFYNQRLL